MDRLTYIQWFYEHYKQLEPEEQNKQMERVEQRYKKRLLKMGEWVDLNWRLTRQEIRLVRAMEDRAWKRYIKHYVPDEKDVIT